MITLAGRVRTPVPVPPNVDTVLPIRRHRRTVVPSTPRVAARVPDARVPTVIPVAPRVSTRRPPTRNRLIAHGDAEVTGSAQVHAHLALEYAEQGVLAAGAAHIAVGQSATNSAESVGSAVVRVRHSVAAVNDATATSAGEARIRHAVAATHTVGVDGTASGVRATYGLAATQAAAVGHDVDARPIVPLDATQDVAAMGVASTVPSVGSVDAQASNSLEVTPAAEVRVRHALAAAQAITITGSAARDKVTIPLAATQAAAVEEQASTRATYRIAAAQSIVIIESGLVVPSLAATQAIATAGASDARGRYTVAAAGSVSMNQSADATARYGTPFSYTDDFSGSLTTNWWRFCSWPASSDYPTTSAGKWTPQGGDTEYKRRHGSVWKTAVPTDTLAYYVQAVMDTLPSTLTTPNRGMGVIVGADDTSDHNNTNGPQAVYCTVTVGNWYVWAAYTGGLQNTNTVNALLASGTGSFTSGGVLRAEVTGDNTLALKWNGTVLASGIDISSYRSGKKVGLAGAYAASKIDNFEASNL